MTVGEDFHGDVFTLELQVQGVRFVPAVGRTGGSLSRRLIYAGRVEIGVAWPQKAGEGGPYHSAKFDDPSLAVLMPANLLRTRSARPSA